ncbi:MAG: tyrosine-type recombinase/integrase [Solirubrobacteraceae bacterium]
MASIKKRPDGKWRARYRDAAGKEHSRHFDRKVDGQRWLDEVTASIISGQYVDPNAGKILFRDYAETWRHAQVHRYTSQLQVEGTLRRHVYPVLGDRQIGSILPSEVQAWVKKMLMGDTARKQKPLAPSTVTMTHGMVSGIFKAAVRDRKIMANPCTGTRLPKVEKTHIRPLTTEQVERLRSLVPDRYKAMIVFTAGTGLRQGEVFAVTRDRLRLLGKDPAVTVDRQLVYVNRRGPQFAPLKTLASNREVPLPAVVVQALNDHIARYDIAEDGLLFTYKGKGIPRARFGHLFRPLAREAGLTAHTGIGMHALRHYYASLLIRYGESVKTVQARLGHASASETLDTYSHLWPDAEDRTREAIDVVLGKAERERRGSEGDEQRRPG